MWLKVKRRRFSKTNTNKRAAKEEAVNQYLDSDSDYVISDNNDDNTSEIDLVLSQLPEKYTKKPVTNFCDYP